MTQRKKYTVAVALMALLLQFTLSPINVSAQETFMVKHPWAGKKVAYFGDSITDPPSW